MSVWAFDEIHAAALPLILDDQIEIRIPTVPGYAAAKLMAWLDRSARYEVKDARDIALVLHRYAEWDEVKDRLWESDQGLSIMLAEDHDVQNSTAHLLGLDIGALIGEVRLQELLVRWPGDDSLLARELQVSEDVHWAPQRRDEIVMALT